MPKTTRPTTATLVPAAATIDELSTAARRAALERWAAWCDELAAGGGMPDVAAVLAAGMALGVGDALAQLTADAAAIVKARRIEERIRGRQAWHAEQLAPFGGTFAALKAEIDRRQAELRELERIRSSLWWDSRLGALRAELQEVKAAAPRVFPPAPKRKRPAPSKPASTTDNRKPRGRKSKAAGHGVEIV